jgi:hypothetical protein
MLEIKFKQLLNKLTKTHYNKIYYLSQPQFNFSESG